MIELFTAERATLPTINEKGIGSRASSKTKEAQDQQKALGEHATAKKRDTKYYRVLR